MNIKRHRNVAVFDFDGTLTTKDTMLEFIKFAYGKSIFYIGFFIHSPFILLMLLNLYPNWKTKQKVFSWFFKGMPYTKFVRIGEEFANMIEKIKKETTLNILRNHQIEGTDIYIISASVYEWVHPFCSRIGVKDVLATQVEVDDNGLLTGRFSSPNCYGEEKVRRLQEVEQARSEYFLYAYGNSKGDRELIRYADMGFYV